VANCKTFFAYAVREELVTDNPFRNQASSLQKNDNGKENISTEIIDKVIEAAPNAEWRLLVALWRYCGLRKSEPMELDWNDVLWAEGKIRVRSPKTAHHAGREMRYVPIRDVETYLSDAFEVAPKGQKHIFGRYVNANSLFHTFEQIVENAGYQPWPNLIKNLRLSCENDWLTAGEAPAHVIAAWIGHSVTVQNSNYAIVSDGHFEQFNARTPDGSKSGNTGGNKRPRIDANDDETMLPPMLPLDGKTLKTNEKPRENAGFRCSVKEQVFVLEPMSRFVSSRHRPELKRIPGQYRQPRRHPDQSFGFVSMNGCRLELPVREQLCRRRSNQQVRSISTTWGAQSRWPTSGMRTFRHR
jgi:hypothetical protein